MRSLATIIHGDLMLSYEYEYRRAHDTDPAPDQLASFGGRSADSKRSCIGRLRDMSAARDAKAITAAVVDTEAEPWPNEVPKQTGWELEQLKVELNVVRRQRDHALASNASLVRRCAAADEMIQNMREVLRA